MQHVLQLYQQEARLADALTEFAAAGLRSDESVVVIASTPRWELLLDRLQTSGMDPRERVLRGQLRLFGLKVVLSAVPNRQRFNEVMNGVLAFAHARHARVRVFSELTDALWRAGELAAACRCERYWQHLLAVQDCQLLCACPIDSLEGNAYDGTLQALCGEHTHVRPAFDEAAFEEAVAGAVGEVLDTELARMLASLSAAHRPSAHMPPGQAILFWLKDHMPRTAERVLSRARARWSEH
ncbi:MAG: MEDS domain-containing protein [Betaproteobacteria bacterium]|nr:MEDS domain-containing protein [Betaproteobacteria bacterium]